MEKKGKWSMVAGIIIMLILLIILYLIGFTEIWKKDFM
jgi:hypothetical protein